MGRGNWGDIWVRMYALRVLIILGAAAPKPPNPQTLYERTFIPWVENQRAYNVTRPAKSKRVRVKAIYHPPLSPVPPQGGFPCAPFAFSRLTPPLIKQDQAGATPS